MDLYHYIVASCTQDGRTAVVYIPKDRCFTLRLGSFGQNVTATWFDPRTGRRTATTLTMDGDVHRFETPTDGDWGLGLQAAA